MSFLPVVSHPAARIVAPAQIRAIQQATAAAFNVTRADLLGARRSHPITDARQLAMYLVRKHTGASYPMIGHYFGPAGGPPKNHTTALVACRKVARQLKSDARLRALALGVMAAALLQEGETNG